jgi:tetratricopeptide (TPR) repeat protein
MKIENLPGGVPHIDTGNVQKSRNREAQDFSRVFQAREQGGNGISLPRQSGETMVRDFAEWYFKLGKSYESTRSYKMAISAYEKSNSVKPDIEKTETVDNVLEKDYAEGRKSGKV